MELEDRTEEIRYSNRWDLSTNDWSRRHTFVHLFWKGEIFAIGLILFIAMVSQLVLLYVLAVAYIIIVVGYSVYDYRRTIRRTTPASGYVRLLYGDIEALSGLVSGGLDSRGLSHRTYRDVVDSEEGRDTMAIVVDDRVTLFLMQVKVRTAFHIGPWTDATRDLVVQVRGIVDEAWEVTRSE